MVYYKLVLNDKRAKNDQVYSVVVRVTYSRVSTTISTGVRVHIEQCDSVRCTVKNSHQNWHLVNRQLLDFYTKVQRLIINLEVQQTFSFEALEERLSQQAMPRQVKIKHVLTSLLNQLLWYSHY